MFGLLLRFREQPVAISAHKDSDQRALRFLWNTAKGIKQYQYTRLIFGAKCSPSIAIFALNQTAKDFAASDRKTAELINRRFYMDDFVHSFESIEIAQASSLKLKTVLNKGGFNLTKFVSNKPEALVRLPETDAVGINSTQRILGVHWDTNDDTMFVKTQIKITIFKAKI